MNNSSMNASVEFDTVLLHLPPINLYTIKLFYRGNFEWFRTESTYSERQVSMPAASEKALLQKPKCFSRCRNLI